LIIAALGLGLTAITTAPTPVQAGAIGAPSGPLCEDFEKMGIAPPADCVKGGEGKTRGLAIGGSVGATPGKPPATPTPPTPASVTAPPQKSVAPAVAAPAGSIEQGLAEIRNELTAIRQEQAQIRELLGGSSGKDVARLEGRIDQINAILKNVIEIKK